MNKLFPSRIFPLILFLMSITILSCDKDNEVSSGFVELLSFGPSGAMHGDTLWFFGNNLDRVTSIELTGATVAQPDFIEQSSEMITIIVPMETERGFVKLKTPQGDLTTKTMLDLEVVVKVNTMPSVARPGETITLTGEYLNWVTRVVFEKGKVVDTFISKSVNELVLKVPIDAQTGNLVIFTGGTEPDDFVTDSSLKITLPSFTSMNPNPVERETNLTITGTNLDLVWGVLFKGKTVADTVFGSRSATSIVVKVPKEANRGKIDLVAYSGVKVESSVEMQLTGDLPPLPDFAHAIYTDGLQNGFQDWSWATRDINNAENVRQGSKSIKATYGGDGYQGISLHNDGGPATGAYTKLEFSVFAPAALDGKKMNLVINGDWGNQYPFTLTGGEWRTFTFNLADIGAPDPLKEVIIQSAGWTGVIYIDHVGLR